jgi:tetratricopeptide (TPR) repeat protein
LGVFDQAIDYASRALDARPTGELSVELLELRARAYRDWGEPELALGDAHRATYRAPKSASAHNTMGTILFALGRSDDAVAAFKVALSLEPAAAWVNNNLCYVALVKGDEPTATERCQAALNADPLLAVARNNLGLVHAAAGRVDVAAREFRASGAAVGQYNLGIVLLAKREYPSALAAFEAALREAPGFDAAFIRAQETRALIARQPRTK